MHKFLIPLLLFFSITSFGQNTNLAQNDLIQLATPNSEFASRFFTKETSVALDFRMEGAQIRYSLDGSAVTSSSPLYTKPLILQKSRTLKYRSFHPDFLPSEIRSEQFLKRSPFPPDTKVILSPPPKAPYNKAGGEALIDLTAGTKDFRQDNSWLGFQTNSLTIKIELPSKQTIKSLKISFLENQNSWIFSPEQIVLKADGDLYFTCRNDTAAQKNKDGFRYLELIDHPFETSWIEITCQGIPAIPAWHPGKGNVPWLFIDEIIME